MNRRLTLLTRGVVYLIGIVALAVCVILLPELAREERVANPAAAPLQYPFLIGAYLTAIPFFLALYKSLKLLGYIDQNQAFSEYSVKALRYIKYCAVTICVLIVVEAIAAISLARSIDPAEDVTGLVTLGFIATLASSVVATFAAVLQRLLHQAIALKSENDLTV